MRGDVGVGVVVGEGAAAHNPCPGGKITCVPAVTDMTLAPEDDVAKCVVGVGEIVLPKKKVTTYKRASV